MLLLIIPFLINNNDVNHITKTHKENSIRDCSQSLKCIFFVGERKKDTMYKIMRFVFLILSGVENIEEMKQNQKGPTYKTTVYVCRGASVLSRISLCTYIFSLAIPSCVSFTECGTQHTIHKGKLKYDVFFDDLEPIIVRDKREKEIYITKKTDSLQFVV